MAKQHYCFLKRFNNYFNRKIIRHESIQDYQQASLDSFIPSLPDGSAMPFDFNPNDNITTEIIVNDVPFDPDYFLLLDDSGGIVSRWFILEQKRNRQGQWLYDLRRDVIADFKEQIANSPAFIEKGMLEDEDSFIFNSEGMNFNQVKKGEFLLKDLSNCAWIVGYIAKNAAASDINITVPTNTEDYINLSVIAADLGISEADLGALLNFDGQNTNVAKFTSKVEFRYGSQFLAPPFNNKLYRNRIYMDGDLNYLSGEFNVALSWAHILVEGYGSSVGDFYSAIGPTIEAEKTNILPNMSTITGRTYLSTSQLTKLRNYIDQVVYYNGNYYRLTLNITGESADAVVGPSVYTSWPSIQTAIENTASSISGLTLKPDGEISIRTTSQNVYIQMAKTDIAGYKSKVSSSRRTVLNENFDMFVIPYGPLTIRGLGADYQNEVDAAIATASKIATELDVALYDLQLLPYYPDGLTFNARGILNMTGKTVDVDYNFIDDSDDNSHKSIIIWCKRNSFQRTLYWTLRSSIAQQYDYGKKLCSECEKYRIVSPNYQGTFEFNLAKNDMQINYFLVECTYKPYTPYIKVAPEFRDLYGRNYGDCRGLVCGGDFSLPRFNSAWENYQLNNKNYQNIFNREIQNLDFEQAQELRYKQLVGLAGIAGAGGSGAAMGAKLGGPYGAIAGAVIGTGVSAAGFALDLDMIGKRHKEARDFAIDKYNYNLGNIKALPYTLTKVSAFDINSKIWPFMEYYCCTEEEILALVEKITYESMTVMRIEQIGNYFKDQPHYLKCQLIRNNEIADDNHLFETIYTELEKGVYI